MSLGSVLNTARSGMLASQRAVEVTANNIANASTPGYTRQRVEQTTMIPERYAQGEFGAGVVIEGSTRARDVYLDAAFRRASGDAAGGNIRSNMLGRMEALLDEPSDTGLSAALDTFYNAWSDFAARPTSASAQTAVQQAGVAVAEQLNRAGNQLASLAGEVRTKFDGVVTEVNDITASIVELNRSIVALESDGHSANALRDARDMKLDRLAELTGAEVIERDSGSVGVLVNGLMLVDGVDRREIAATTINGALEVTRADLPNRPLQVGGELGGIRMASTGDIPRMQAELDSLARGIVESVNALHRTGVTWSGTPPVSANAGDFFASDPLVAAELDPLRTARGIRLDSAVAANASAIAASPATATGPGDSSLALQLSQLRDRPVPFTDSTGATIATESAGDFFRRIATDTAFLARSVGDRAEVDAALTSQADTRRQEVSGVSIDEELVRLIKFQQAYAAAARMIQTVDQMSQTLLDIRR